MRTAWPYNFEIQLAVVMVLNRISRLLRTLGLYTQPPQGVNGLRGWEVERTGMPKYTSNWRTGDRKLNRILDISDLLNRSYTISSFSLHCWLLATIKLAGTISRRKLRLQTLS